MYSGTYFYNINAGEEKSIAATKTFILTLAIITKLISVYIIKTRYFKKFIRFT